MICENGPYAEVVGMHDTFFESGGHSLIAIQLRYRIQAAFDVDIPLSRFFEALTIHEMVSEDI